MSAVPPNLRRHPFSIFILVASALLQQCAPITAAAARDDDTTAVANQCTLYLAPSSIPNAGLGTYTAIPIRPNTPIGPPELMHTLIDVPSHTSALASDSSILSDYDWQSVDYHAHLEGRRVQSIIPGLGAAINSHPGLYNTMPGLPSATFSSAAVAGGHGGSNETLLDRRSELDFGVGSITYYGNVSTYAVTSVEAGGELFAHYSDAYFADRTSSFGTIPLSEHYDQADKFVKRFVDFIEKNGNIDERGGEDEKRLSDEVLQDLWSSIVNSFGVHEEDYDDGTTVEEEGTIRLHRALPKSVPQLHHAAKVGTASASLPNAIRSVDWLHGNGKCLDNLRPGQSAIPQAGRGAFATRPLPRGTSVLPLPLLQINRTLLDMVTLKRDPNHDDEEEGGARKMLKGKKVVGRQLFLNYCLGHADSSVLLYPYSNMANYVNHASGDRAANVELRWNDDGFGGNYHHQEWLDDDAATVLGRGRAGLMLELVATRDIADGEEVLLDYGDDWTEAWEDHVTKWRAWVTRGGGGGSAAGTTTLRSDYVYPHAFDSDPTVRTQSEQMDDPYPSNIMTACYHTTNDDDVAYPLLARTVGLGGKETRLFGREWREATGQQQPALRLCKVLERNASPKKDGEYVYTVALESVDDLAGHSSDRVVYDAPRFAIKFVDAPYRSDQHLVRTFRHEIGIPNHVFPERWMNLKT